MLSFDTRIAKINVKKVNITAIVKGDGIINLKNFSIYLFNNNFKKEDHPLHC